MHYEAASLSSSVALASCEFFITFPLDLRINSAEISLITVKLLFFQTTHLKLFWMIHFEFSLFGERRAPLPNLSLLYCINIWGFQFRSSNFVLALILANNFPSGWSTILKLTLTRVFPYSAVDLFIVDSHAPRRWIDYSLRSRQLVLPCFSVLQKKEMPVSKIFHFALSLLNCVFHFA